MATTRPPDKRIAYDIDGTVVGVWREDTNTFTYLTPAQRANLNDPTGSNVLSSPSGGNPPPNWLFFLFPRPTTVAGLWAAVQRGSAIIGSAVRVSSWAYSLDTTDGSDGSWTHVGAGTDGNINNLTWALDGVQRFNGVEPEVWTEAFDFGGTPVDNVLGVRFYFRGGNTNDAYVRSAAIYGHPTTPTGLEVWHPTLDQAAELADLDWGFHARLTQDTKQLRLKNTHPTFTFTGIQLGLDDISGDSPAAGDNHQLSADGLAWSSTIALADLAPGAISPVFYVRRNTPSNAIIGPTGIYEVRLVPSFTGLS